MKNNFSSLPTPKRSKARNEFERIEKFKGKLGRRALYHTYTDLKAFDEYVMQHMNTAVNA